MNPRLLAGVTLGLVALILVSRARRQPAEPAPTPAAPVEAEATPAPAAPRRTPRVAPLPNALNPRANATREVDVLAILALRRRISREGNRIYLDSMFAQTDSVVVRWPDDRIRDLQVAFMVDSSLDGWSASYLEAARAGMRGWQGNAAGIRLQEVTDPGAAEIQVFFAESVSDTSRFGVTQLNWGSDGIVTHADIRLAIHPNPARAPLSPETLRRVATHEFGHALGLPHSDGRGDLMFPSSSVASPSRRDQATLQMLYALPPGSIRTP